ncbi:hypothetical protein DTO212C5_4821 [Paecilomyces variotii]|nr:hypothetical protein DTO212C5_4821 [Paecilomyces variotii]
MGCCGDREKQNQIRAEQKWDYITLDDFKSSSCLTPFSYFFLYVFLLVSIAVYSVDTFTAIQLIAFAHWAGQIKPSIPFTVSRWIFAICICISFLLLIYRWIRAIRAMRTGGVAESYLDPLAVRIQSIRTGKRGRGWKRFLVFAELTKSKKGAEYIALFAYFSFESWLRVVFAEGPRQVVNAITLYSVMQLNLIPEGQHAAPKGTPPIEQFFINVKALAEKNDRQAVVLFGMLFTLIIWVISVLSLAVSVILYLIFLWHHIPTEDGSLRAYCRRKINTRLERIVKQKVNKALAKGVVLQDRKPTQPNVGAGADLKPSLPTLPSVAGPDYSRLPLSRTTTQTTLPPYTSRPGTAAPDEKPGSLRQPTLPDLGLDNKSPLTRTTTQGSSIDESSFMENSRVVGYSPLDRYQPSPAPSVPTLPDIPPVPRSYTPVSGPPMAQGRPAPGPSHMNGPNRGPANGGYPGPGQGYGYPPCRPPPAMGRPGLNPPDRVNSPAGTAPPRSFTPMGNPPGRPFSPAVNAPERPYSPSASSVNSTRQFTPANGNTTAPPRNDQSYVPFNPGMGPRAAEPRNLTPASPSYANASFARPSPSPSVPNGSRPPPQRSYSPARYNGY